MTVQAPHTGAKVEGARSPASSPGSVRDSVPHLLSFPKSHNSANSDLPQCPNPSWARGVCEPHGNVHHRAVPCKRRDCPVCGPQGRLRIAQRIAWGVRTYGADNCAWLTLTFDTEMAEETWWKPIATRRVSNLVRWLRKKRGMSALEYADTYELQRRGRLHINLICSDWKYVPQKLLQERWGARVWVSKVIDTSEYALGAEVAKAYSPEGLGSYISKLEQAVPAEWGRRVSFSRGWPKLPGPDDGLDGSPLSLRPSDAVGIVRWESMTEAWLGRERDDKGSVELRPGEYAVGSVKPNCDCFMSSKQRRERLDFREGRGVLVLGNVKNFC